MGRDMGHKIKILLAANQPILRKATAESVNHPPDMPFSTAKQGW